MLLPLCSSASAQLARVARPIGTPRSIGIRSLGTASRHSSSATSRALNQAEPTIDEIQRDVLDAYATEQTEASLATQQEWNATIHSSAPTTYNRAERLRTHIHESRSNKGILLSSAVAVPLTRADKVSGPLRTLALDMVRGVEAQKQQNAYSVAPVELTDDQVNEVVTSMVDAAAQAMKPRMQPADAVRQAMGWDPAPDSVAVAEQDKGGHASVSRRPRRGMEYKVRLQFTKESQLPFQRMLTDATRPIDQMLEKANQAQQADQADQVQPDQPFQPQ